MHYVCEMAVKTGLWKKYALTLMHLWDRQVDESPKGLKEGCIDLVVWILANSPYLVVWGLVLAAAVIAVRKLPKRPIRRKAKKESEE